MKRYLCCVGLLLCVGCEPEPSCVESSTCKSTLKDAGTDARDAPEPDVAGRDIAFDGASEPRLDGTNDGNDVRIDPNVTDIAAEKAPDVVGVEDARDAMATADVGDVADTRGCDTTKRPVDDRCVVDEKYGVFVSPYGDDINGSGSKTAPYLTLNKGIAIAAIVGSERRVYACDDGTGYLEQVVLPAGAKLYGGFNCDKEWTYGATQRAVVRAPASPALAITSGTVGVVVEDFEFIAPDASDPDASTAGTGASSIAAIIDTSTDVVLRHVRLVANKAGDGASGADGTKGDDAPDGMAPELQGKNAYCSVDAGTAQLGGAWSGLLCGSKGGNGGTANLGSTGSAGVDGTPVGNANGGHVGANGGDGANGGTGSHGTLATPVGVFSATGYAVATGGTGAEGKVGQGGGGGAASSPLQGSSCLGASGGAGGMGGCGGKAGIGGTGGGASVALVSLLSGITLDTCTLVASNGGAGGKGGNGAIGGFGKGGGQGGMGSTGSGIPNGSHGGLGGDGGTGGAGAGGSGGPSHAIVTKGASPNKVGPTTLLAGMGGTAGIGGSNGTKAPDGSVGSMGNELTIQ